MQDNSLNRLIIVSRWVEIATKWQNSAGYLIFLSYLSLLSFWGSLIAGIAVLWFYRAEFLSVAVLLYCC